MRIPQWFLVVWVVFSLFFSAAGSYVAYTQSQQRTRELAEIGLLSDDTDLVHTGELLLGLEDPEIESEDVPLPSPTTVAVQNTPSPTSSEPSSTPDPAASPLPATDTPQPAATAELPPEYVYTDPRRVTVVLLGIDQRQGEEGPFLTDTIMLLSLDPIAKTGAILSVPRDLWIEYPGIGSERINNANRVGEQRQYPGGGAEYAKRIISSVLGIPVHYYVMINFDAFLTFVDVIGDVEVCPEQDIDDPKYPDGSYGVRPIFIEAGCQDMGGDDLLVYSRTRATEGGDVDRAKRQQEVVFAIREKVLSAGGIFSIISNPLELWDALQANLRTDLDIETMIGLARLAQDVPRDNIRQGQISYGEVELQTGPGGEQILVPIQSDIIALVSDLFRRAGEPSTREPQ